MRTAFSLEGILLLAVVSSVSCGPGVERLVAQGRAAMAVARESKEQSDWLAAAKSFEEALSRDATLAEVYRDLAYCRIALGDRDAAAEALRGLLRLRPDDCRAHHLLAQYAAEQGRWEDAVSHIVRARRFAEYRDEILATQRTLNEIKAAVTARSAEASTTILEPTGEIQ